MFYTVKGGTIMSRKKKRVLKKLKLGDVVVFKIANRRGYATIALNNLTEGRSIPQAYARLIKACKRNGYELPADRTPHRLTTF
jgi:predicted peroxiredoxin